MVGNSTPIESGNISEEKRRTLFKVCRGEADKQILSVSDYGSEPIFTYINQMYLKELMLGTVSYGGCFLLFFL